MGKNQKSSVSGGRVKRIVFRVLAVLLGLAAVLAILEIGLRRAAREVAREPLALNADVVILCVGDSHTAGLEAPPNLDYPSQLEILLNMHDLDRIHQVINLGQGGLNSSQVVQLTMDYLARAERVPDIIIFCAGINNKDNFAGASFLPEEVRNSDINAQLRYLLAHSRAYRLGQLTIERLQEAGAQKPKTYQELTNTLLNASAPEDISFLVDWISSDLEALFLETHARGIVLVLLTYHQPNPWQLGAYQDIQMKYGLPIVNMIDYGGLSQKHLLRLTAPGYHPNKLGYYLIAQKLVNELQVFLYPLAPSGRIAEPPIPQR